MAHNQENEDTDDYRAHIRMLVHKPNGSLNITTDPTELPDDGFARLKNMSISRIGRIDTRKGSAKVNKSAIANTDIDHITEQGGVRYVFSDGEIYRNESALSVGGANAQWSSMLYNAYNDTTQQVFCLNGTDRKRVEGSTVYEWGFDAPTFDYIVAGKSKSTLTGTYSVRVTQARKVGSTVVYESNPGVASNSVVLANEGISVWFDRPNASGITHTRVYRSTSTNASHYYEAEVETPFVTTPDYGYTQSWETDYISGTGYQFGTTSSNFQISYGFETNANSDSASYSFAAVTHPITDGILFSSAVADGSLSTEVSTDHNRPPQGTIVIGPNYDGTCFIVKDNFLYYCKPRQPEYWPSTYFIEVSAVQFPLVTAVFHNGQPYALTKTGIYHIVGTAHPLFQPIDMKAKTGAQGAYGAISVAGLGIVHVGKDGIYVFNGGSDIKITQNVLDVIFKGESSGGLPAVTSISTAWLGFYKDHLYFGYTSSGNSYPTNIVKWQISEQKRLTYYQYSFPIRCITSDETNDRFLAGCSDGFVRALESGTTDDGTAISWEMQTKDYTLQTRKHFPRWTKYDVDASGATSVTGSVLLDGTSIQTHMITGSRNTKRRLIDSDNGDRLSHKITGSGPATIYAIESK